MGVAVIRNKKGDPRESGIPNYVLGIILSAPKSNRAATHEYCESPICCQGGSFGGPRDVTKIMGFMGATTGSAIGWWAGAHVGIMTAFMLSIVGTAVGVYGGKQLAGRLGY